MSQVALRASISWKFKLYVALAIFVVALLGLYLIYQKWQSDSALRVDNEKFNILQSQQQTYADREQYDQGATAWINYASHAKTRDHKGMAYLYAAALYMENQQLNQAATMLPEAEAADGVSFNEADVAATIYLQLGDRQEAIHSYQEAILLCPPSDDQVADIAGFKVAIKELQDGQIK
jgi:tetratricopeptide (TPR) repeat protein